MRKICSIITVLLIILATVWAAVPVLATELSAAESTDAQIAGECTTHDFGDWSAEIPAGCTTIGYHYRICKNCDAVEAEKTKDKLGHNCELMFDEATKTHKGVCKVCNAVVLENCAFEPVAIDPADAACDTIATHTYKCTKCPGSYSVEETVQHQFTCTPSEITDKHIAVCAACGETTEESCSYTVMVSSAVNCLAAGTTTMQCKCGNTTEIPAIALGSHTIESYIHVAGSSKHVGICSVCGASESADCTLGNFTKNDGNTTHTATCSLCLASVTEDCVPGAYTPDTETTHKAVCKCGREYTGDCTADAKDYSSAGSGKHTALCKECNRQFTAACTPIKPEHKENTETHSGLCSVCGNVSTYACTVETWKTSTDEVHAGSCKDCGKEYKEACTGADYALTLKTVDGKLTGTCTGKCTVCGGAVTHAADLGEWTYDAEQNTHTIACKTCKAAASHTVAVETWAYSEDAKNHTGKCTECQSAVTAACDFKQDSENPHKYICTVCGGSYENKHKWEKNTETSYDATCTEDGKAFYTCSICGETSDEWTQNFPATGHTLEATNDKAVKVDDKNHTVKYKCETCGEIVTENEAHAWVAGKAANADTQNHTVTYKCEACGATKTESKKHEMAVDSSAKITSDIKGHTTTYKCTVDGCTYTELKTENHKLGKATTVANTKTHNRTCEVCKTVVTELCKGTKVAGKAATCTTTGLSIGEKCADCGNTLIEQEEIAALGHDYQVVSTKATCIAAGETILKCSRKGCTETQTRTDPATNDHDWTLSNRVAPTAEANGYVEYKCKNCTATYKETLVYSVYTGVSDTMAPAAALILLSGAAFLALQATRKKDEK